jgi:hypothetical protein
MSSTPTPKLTVALVLLVSGTISCTPYSSNLDPRHQGDTGNLRPAAHRSEAQYFIPAPTYQITLDLAREFDQNSLVTLFGLQFKGAPSQTHAENLKKLMFLWGDAQFAQVLERQPSQIKKRVIALIESVWDNPEWSIFSETFTCSR